MSRWRAVGRQKSEMIPIIRVVPSVPGTWFSVEKAIPDAGFPLALMMR